MTALQIKCQGAAEASLDFLTEFQGELKSLANEDYEKFKAQLLELGFCEPLTVWNSKDYGVLIANGHQRVRTLSRMEKEGIAIPSLPISYVHPKDKAEFAKIVLSLCSQYGAIEKEGMFEYCTLHNIPVDYLETRLRLPELDIPQYKAEFYEEEHQGLTDADAVPETRKTDIKRGDLFQLGNHRLLCGDATSKEDVERLMNGEKADMVFTSPPYNLGHNQMPNSQSPQKKYKSWEADQKSEEDYLALLTRFLETARNVSGYQFVNLQMLEPNKRSLLDWLYDQKSYFADVLIWDKRHGPIASTNQFNSQFEFVFVFGPNKGQNRGINLKPFGNFPNVFQLAASGQIEENTFDHRAMFPVALPEKFISELLEPGGIVLEPFCGSGSTLIACEKTNRKCFGMEIDPQYCQVIIDRFEKFSGIKAKKIS